MCETLFYATTNSLPFHLFAYIPFWEHLRFSKRRTLLLLLAEQLLYLALLWGLLHLEIPPQQAQFIAMPLYGILFFYFVDMDKGRIAFLYIFTTDYLMLLTGTVSFIGRFISDLQLFSWQAGMLLLLFFALSAPFMVHFLCRTARDIFAIHAPEVWRTVWIIPLFISAIVLVSTYPATQASVQSLLCRLLLMGCMFVIYHYIILIIQQVQKNAAQREHTRHMEHLVKIQTSHYSLLKTHIEETRRARHDLRQHLTALQGCIDSGNPDALAAYVKKYGEDLPRSIPVFCQNPAVDAILYFYAQQAAQADIAMDISFQIGDPPIIPEPELCVLLGNLLENALEACASSSQDLPREKCKICVRAQMTGTDMMALTVDNSSVLPPKKTGDGLLSGKHEGLGVGTASVRMIAEKYHGDARFEWKDGIFYASVLLNP